jgi:dipeptidyl aminopeptidase/acylaminoacyl peptidase
MAAEDAESAVVLPGEITLATHENRTTPDADSNSEPAVCMRLNPNNGQTTLLFEHESGIWDLHCSPDRKHVAFIDFNKTAWSCAATNGVKPTKIADDAISIAGSSDGKQVIYTASGDKWMRLADGRRELARTTFLVNADGSERKPLPIPPTHYVIDWSVDHKHLLTILAGRYKPWSNRHPTANEYRTELFILNMDGTVKTALTPEGEDNTEGRFSPDGGQVAFRDSGVGPWHFSIGVVNIDGTERRTIVPHRELTTPSSIAWAPDGRFLLVGIRTWRKAWGGGYTWSSETPLYLEVFDLEGHSRQILKPSQADWTKFLSFDWR